MVPGDVQVSFQAVIGDLKSMESNSQQTCDICLITPRTRAYCVFPIQSNTQLVRLIVSAVIFHRNDAAL